MIFLRRNHPNPRRESAVSKPAGQLSFSWLPRCLSCKWYRSIDIPPGEKLEAINGYSISSWVANQHSTVSMCGKSIFAYFLERFRPPNPRDPRVSCEIGGPPAPSPTVRWEAYNCQKSKEENRTSSAKLTRTKNINYSWRKLILIF